MNRLKEKLYHLGLALKKSIEKFPLTIITAIILTIIYAVNLENDFIDTTAISNLTLFGLIFASGAFLIETIITTGMKNRARYYIISALIAGLFTYIANTKGDFLGIDNFLIEKLFICYEITVLVLAVYYNYRKSNKTFEEYVTSVFVNVCKSSIVYGILSIGIAMVIGIFTFLILDGNGYMLIARAEILILGIYYIPTIIYSFYNIEEKTAKFARAVIKYVLGTLLIAAFAIIYMYMIKIIISRKVPVNQIFSMLAMLFIVGCPIWTMIAKFKEDGLLDKINKKLPILFMPFIILQIYSIGVRIINNGITESRYLGIMIVVFEIIYIIMYLKNREKIEKILLVFIALAIISILVPYVNMFKVSEFSQYNNLKIYKQKTQYTDEEKEKIYGAYRYLTYNSINGKEYVNKLLTKSEQEEIKGLHKKNNTEYSDINRTHSIYVAASVKQIDVGEYGKLYNIEASSGYYYNGTKKNIDEVFDNLELKIGDNQETIHIDILEKVNEYIGNEEKLNSYFQYMNEIQLDNDRKVILTNLSIRYEEESKKIESYRISGYLLEK